MKFAAILAISAGVRTAWALENEEGDQCEDFEPSDQAGCPEHLNWALNTGIKTRAWDYVPGTTESTADLQCNLFLKQKDLFGGSGHGCSQPPCSEISPSLKADENAAKYCTMVAPPPRAPYINRVTVVTLPPTTTTTTAAPAGSSVDWWVIALIAAASVALIAAVAGCFMMRKSTPKKTRTIKAPMPAAAKPEPHPVAPVPVAPAPELVQTTMTAMPVYTAPPVYASAPAVQSVYMQQPAAPPVTVAAPVVTAPPVMGSMAAMPVSTMVAQPVTSMLAQPLTTISAAAPVMQVAQPVSTMRTQPVATMSMAAPTYYW